jgi:hypothetical protein
LKAENKQSTANELTLDSVGGIFVVLIAGMGIACAISVMEFLWKGGRLERKVSADQIKIYNFYHLLLVCSEAQLTSSAGSSKYKFQYFQHYWY